MNTTETPRS